MACRARSAQRRRQKRAFASVACGMQSTERVPELERMSSTFTVPGPCQDRTTANPYSSAPRCWDDIESAAALRTEQTECSRDPVVPPEMSWPGRTPCRRSISTRHLEKTRSWRGAAYFAGEKARREEGPGTLWLEKSCQSRNEGGASMGVIFGASKAVQTGRSFRAPSRFLPGPARSDIRPVRTSPPAFGNAAAISRS